MSELLPVTREVYEREEQKRLAPCATASVTSRGRVWPEDEHLYRTAFQRDRDRIVHSSAFRRLEYKTQVFVYHEGDHYRNRLTHTLEGAQIARTIARALRLNEDLAEAIALAHDLGHTPFGHAGERVLRAMLKEHGGFDHNRQSLRVVDLLERRYPGFLGLNLTAETREGILKHGCDWDHPVPLPELSRQRGLEAQVADSADEIAYVNHDLDDALRSGIVDLEMAGELPLVADIAREVAGRVGDASHTIRRAQIIVGLINRLVSDLIEATQARIEAGNMRSPEAVRDCESVTAGFSQPLEQSKRELLAFLSDNFYNHPRVARMTHEAEGIVEELFRLLCRDPALLPDQVRQRFDREGAARAVADYVAGMTDRFAMAEHRKLLDSGETRRV